LGYGLVRDLGLDGEHKEEKMTNKERREIKKLVRMMREAGVRYRASKPVIELLEGGADEIEWLVSNAQSDAEPTHRDMAYFGASEAACYYYPGKDEQLLRDAYCRGAAEYAPKPLT
jgi:hypothetical protein